MPPKAKTLTYFADSDPEFQQFLAPKVERKQFSFPLYAAKSESKGIFLQFHSQSLPKIVASCIELRRATVESIPFGAGDGGSLSPSYEVATRSLLRPRR